MPPSFLKVALRPKGLKRRVLVTDAVMPAACLPGDYRLGEVEVTLHPPGDRVTLKHGDRLAGSALRMNEGVANLMRLGNLSLREAVTMATTNAARAGRIGGRQGRLNPRERTDPVEFTLDQATHTFTIERTWIGGRMVYERADCDDSATRQYVPNSP